MPYKYNPFTKKPDYYEPQIIETSIWILGQGIPSDDLGQNGDFYTDTLTFNIYKKTNGTWF
jgi:hypothetical protein